jgi:GH25 family lysozyme M1 (1,4-beta-N-acetylmuramidase)
MGRRLLAFAMAFLALATALDRAAAANGRAPERWHRASDGLVPSGEGPDRRGPAAPNPNWLEGIDISHWNGEIDWPKVAGAGISFAIMKATEGRTYVDTTYAGNRAAAKAAGLVVTAYHFARPDGSAGDAVAEARHFVDNASIAARDIVPVLDLEVTGGMGRIALTNWAWTWLEEVERLLRVKPMIYSGPYRWSTVMADTTEFADAGYRLWLAHWTEEDPWVPAEDWGGNGWTFWQYTDCGSVPGIDGCVDLDRYRGPFLNPVRLPVVSVSTGGPGSVASNPGGISCGTACSNVFEPGSTVTMQPTPEAGAVLVRWEDACTGPGACQVTAVGTPAVHAVFGYRLSIRLAGDGGGSVTRTPGGPLGCGEGGTCSAAYPAGATVTLTATPDADSGFDGWSGGCSGEDATCVVTMDRARWVTATFSLLPTYQPDGRIKLGSDTDFVGGDVYGTWGQGQTRAVTAGRSVTKTFLLAFQNDGTVPDGYTVDGSGWAPGFTIRYLATRWGSTDITADVVAGRYELSNVAPGATRYLRMVITVKPGAAIGTRLKRLVTATSAGDPTMDDAVRGTVRVVAS